MSLNVLQSLSGFNDLSHIRAPIVPPVSAEEWVYDEFNDRNLVQVILQNGERLFRVLTTSPTNSLTHILTLMLSDGEKRKTFYPGA